MSRHLWRIYSGVQLFSKSHKLAYLYSAEKFSILLNIGILFCTFNDIIFKNLYFEVFQMLSQTFEPYYTYIYLITSAVFELLFWDRSNKRLYWNELRVSAPSWGCSAESEWWGSLRCVSAPDPQGSNIHSLPGENCNPQAHVSCLKQRSALQLAWGTQRPGFEP